MSMKVRSALAWTAPVLGGLTTRADDRPYPRPELLAEPTDFLNAAPGVGLVVLDARERAGHDAGHVPGTRWVDHAAWAKQFGDGTDAAGWGGRIGALGAAPASRVVAYDDNLTRDAARVWW